MTMPVTLSKRLVLLALCACSMAAQAQNAPSRIGFIYTERLMTESKLAKAADAKIEAEFSKRQKAIQDTISRSPAAEDAGPSRPADPDVPSSDEP